MKFKKKKIHEFFKSFPGLFSKTEWLSSRSFREPCIFRVVHMTLSHSENEESIESSRRRGKNKIKYGRNKSLLSKMG